MPAPPSTATRSPSRWLTITLPDIGTREAAATSEIAASSSVSFGSRRMKL